MSGRVYNRRSREGRGITAVLAVVVVTRGEGLCDILTVVPVVHTHHAPPPQLPYIAVARVPFQNPLINTVHLLMIGY